MNSLKLYGNDGHQHLICFSSLKYNCGVRHYPLITKSIYETFQNNLNDHRI